MLMEWWVLDVVQLAPVATVVVVGLCHRARRGGP